VGSQYIRQGCGLEFKTSILHGLPEEEPKSLCFQMPQDRLQFKVDDFL
jgi:hypothetical protein